MTPLRRLRADLIVLLGIRQKVHDLLELQLRSVAAGHIIKSDAVWGSISIFTFRLKHAHGPAGAALCRPCRPCRRPVCPGRRGPPNSTNGKRQIGGQSPLGVAVAREPTLHREGTLLALSCVTSSGTSVGRISTECLAPSASKANRFWSRRRRQPALAPSLPTTSKNSETAQRDPSAAKAALLEARAAPAARLAPKALVLRRHGDLPSRGGAPSSGAGARRRSARGPRAARRARGARGAGGHGCFAVLVFSSTEFACWRVLAELSHTGLLESLLKVMHSSTFARGAFVLRLLYSCHQVS